MQYIVRVGILNKISKNLTAGLSFLVIGIISMALSQPIGIQSLIPIGGALASVGAAIIGRAHS